MVNRNIDESQSGSSRQQSVVPSTGSKRSSFIDSEFLTGSQQQQVKKLKPSKSEKRFLWKYFKKLYTGSTSNMIYHLNTAHNKTVGDEEKEEQLVQQRNHISIS
ncbi:hypothetical protein RCL_jg14041.t1 [Rhizophagus clarus]|uniref:Uncharacterized protein n=1 Tax=Rhizophagus clarus TaxID=94130 RepID=A0A8H3LSA2_9GLOM|nr:hypothetical protein RCL_jg14041.t1 [Rhizophagus clarus]